MAFLESRNRSTVTHFLLLGFSNDADIQIVLFLIFLVVYVVLLVANILLILAVTFDPRLHNPMYFFLINLSIINICGPSAIVPRMLVDFLSGDKSIVFAACAAQMFLNFLMGGSECLLLVFMAYDRYVAICKPLHYSRIVKISVCALMATVTWLTSFSTSSLNIFIVYRLTFCGPYIINHFLCTFPHLMILSCSDTSVSNSMAFIGSAPILLIPLLLILFSYYKILSSIKGIRGGRYKAFSSCTPHLIVVTLYYGLAMVTFMKRNVSVNDNSDKIVSLIKIISLFYVIIIPMLNPMIYSLRNKDVIRALRHLVRLQ
uniref:Olfactory receptor n=1 Tax=Leptobrachium leishanense TaxID=445787 RepID=A0A8C5M984_9ANUR